MIAETILSKLDPTSRESWTLAGLEIGAALRIWPASEALKLLEGLTILASKVTNEGDVGLSQSLISVLTGYINT
jgi:hypothetical protein